MAASTTSNTPSISKSAAKKKAKAEAAAVAPTSESGTITPNAAAGDVNGEADSENPYIKNLQKNLRGVNKKINAAVKTESLTSGHAGKTLDELVKSKVLNNDQKAQIEKKSSLEAQAKQLEEQIAQFKAFAAQYEDQISQDKSSAEQSHKESLEKAKAEAAAEAKEIYAKQQKDTLLVLSQFLRAAAAKRQEGDETTSENRGFEGALYQVYGGSTEAVAAMLKLVESASENVPAIDGEPLEYTYAQVKEASSKYGISVDEPAATEPQAAPESDPTVANAGMTELEDTTAVATNGAVEDTGYAVPSQAGIDAEAANAVAESSWDKPQAVEENITLPRDPAETDTGFQATPAADHTNSWAEDVPVEAPVVAAAEPANDGFEQVVHSRPNPGRGRGSFRGRGRGGEGFRGRGGRGGEGRGRGGRGRGGEWRGGRGGRGGQGQRENQSQAPAASS